MKTFEKDLAAKGNAVVANLTYALDINTVSQDTSAIVARLAEEEITTVICFTDPISPLFYTAKATQQRYFPEWIVTGVAATDSDIAGQQYDQQQWQHTFGIRTLTENTPRRGSVAYAAFKAARPDQEPAGLALFGIYARLLQVALAIQARRAEPHPGDLRRRAGRATPAAPGCPARGGAAPATTRSRSTPRRCTGTRSAPRPSTALPGTYVADQPALRGRPVAGREDQAFP